MRSRLRAPACVMLALLVLLSLGFAKAGPSSAQGSAETELAERYAPVIARKAQQRNCDNHGEAFRPVPVDVVLGRNDVVLRGPAGERIAAPTAADLYGRGDGWFLDFPGDALSPGCDYERWFDQIAADVPTTVYAHVVTEPGHDGFIALQYWLYWPYNDWNNRHESDWEMIQLVFPAGSAEAALNVDPVEVGYSQHTGAERAEWQSTKLEKAGGHPVIFASRGSHANHYGQGLYLGYSSDEGFGCDDTENATLREQAAVIVLPHQPTGPGDAFAWLSFAGRWGERRAEPNNGPTGPALKRQWDAPMSWAEDEWRGESLRVPSVSTIAPSATDFFCSAVSRGSMFYFAYLRQPWFVLGLAFAFPLAGLWLVRRTAWSPAPHTPVDRKRRAGEILRAAAVIYRRRLFLFAGIGFTFLPIGVVAAFFQWLAFDFTPLGTLASLADNDGIVGGVAALSSGAFTAPVAAVVVYAATAVAVDSLDRPAELSILGAHQQVLRRARHLTLASLRVFVVVALLTITVIGIPFAVVYLIWHSLANQAVMIEKVSATAALGRSEEIVRGDTLRTFGVLAFVNLVIVAAGPVLGIVALFLWNPSLAVINLISAAAYAILVPYAGIVAALLFYDLRHRAARDSGAPRTGTGA